MSRQEIADRVGKLREVTGRPLWVEYSGSPQRPRVVEGLAGIRPVSRRMTTKDLGIWLDGAEAFAAHGPRKGRV